VNCTLRFLLSGVSGEERGYTIGHVPSWDIFDHQLKQYRNSMLPPDVKARIVLK
jgi:hypothetical protein